MSKIFRKIILILHIAYKNKKLIKNPKTFRTKRQDEKSRNIEMKNPGTSG